MNRITTLLTIASMSATPCAPASAAVTQYTEFAAWQAAGGSYSTISFAEFTPGTIITDQYQALRVRFVDGDDRIFATPSFVIDGYGLSGGLSFTGTTISLEFSEAQYWIGVDQPGGIQIQLFRGGSLVYTSGGFGSYFFGLVSTEPFDAAKLLDPADGYVFIDDLHFGHPIPAPAAALPLLGIGIMSPGRRRRP